MQKHAFYGKYALTVKICKNIQKKKNMNFLYLSMINEYPFTVCNYL